MKENKKNLLLFSLIFFVFIALIFTMIFIYINTSNTSKKDFSDKLNTNVDGFNNKIIKELHKDVDNKNYIISPYSLEVVLSMLRDGASGKTYEELNELVPKREIKYFFAKERINVANALFIKNGVELNSDFENMVKNDYNSEFLYDEFKTPAVINDWANRETYGMIPRVMEEINPEFLFGLGNAVAIDVKWQDTFKCSGTKLEEFNMIDGNKINVAMMHNTYDRYTAYYKDSNATYVSIPYASYNEDGEQVMDDGTQLEFIGILPKDDINKFIKTFNFNNIGNIVSKMKKADDTFNIKVSLPKFKYNNSFDNLNKKFKTLGLENAFGVHPQFDKMAEYDMNISNMLHKTFIELSEYGTKAAAVTVVTFDATSLPEAKPEVVEINFDKPFVYLIKDSDSDEILFYGVVYSPTEYGENDVLCEEDNF